MNRRFQSVFLIVAAGLLAANAIAQNPPPSAPKNFPARFSVDPTNPLPPLPPVQSPVDFFRKLLAMSPRERLDLLTNRQPALRIKILAKVREYEMLSPDERELRLRATELRWYLLPLLRAAPADRESRLAAMPDALRELIRSRLMQWDILPPPLQQEFLANEKALHYFAQMEISDNSPPDPRLQKVSEQFDQFFELTPEEKQQTLNILSEPERAQMEKTLQAFDQLPPPQRLQCVRNFSKFAGLTPADRAEFLKNAEHWSQMSPDERQAWRDLVAHVPEWPPLPPPLVPASLIPHPPAKLPRGNVATN